MKGPGVPGTPTMQVSSRSAPGVDHGPKLVKYNPSLAGYGPPLVESNPMLLEFGMSVT